MSQVEIKRKGTFIWTKRKHVMDVAFPAKQVHMGRSLVEKITIFF